MKCHTCGMLLTVKDSTLRCSDRHVRCYKCGKRFEREKDIPQMTQMKLADKALFTRTQIQKRVLTLAEEIDAHYLKSAYSLVLVCVLKGAYVFCADLSRALHTPHSIEFVGIESYGTSTSPEHAPRWSLRLRENLRLRDKDVLIVEDIVDTGATLKAIRAHIENDRWPASVSTVALLYKQRLPHEAVACREALALSARFVDFVGFDIVPGKFVVGYGLDYAKQYRGLPCIGVMEANR